MNAYDMYCFNIAREKILRRIKAELGLRNAHNFGSGSAPASDEIMDFFAGLDLPVSNIYGMSETMSVGTMGYSKFQSRRQKSVGKVLDGVQSKILNPGKNKQGEVCFKGRSVFMGYLNSEEKTHETIQDDGWMKTGDLGYFDKEDFLYITGRLKELIITAGGENIPPLMIEEEILKELPILGNAMVVGDGERYLTLLITLKSEREKETEKPTPNLAPCVKNWISQKGYNLSVVSEVQSHLAREPHGNLSKGIQGGIDRYNERAVSNIHQIKKWILLPQEFSAHGGELTDTLKLKRAVVCSKYEDEIRQMYNESTIDVFCTN